MRVRWRHIGLGVLVLADFAAYALAVAGFFQFAASDDAAGRKPVEAVLLRVVPILAIPAIAGIVFAGARWRGQRVFGSVVLAACIVLVVDWIAIVASVPVI